MAKSEKIEPREVYIEARWSAGFGRVSGKDELLLRSNQKMGDVSGNEP